MSGSLRAFFTTGNAATTVAAEQVPEQARKSLSTEATMLQNSEELFRASLKAKNEEILRMNAQVKDLSAQLEREAALAQQIRAQVPPCTHRTGTPIAALDPHPVQARTWRCVPPALGHTFTYP